MCKACAAKLSPWFSERRQSTVAEIQAQLDYRKETISFRRSLCSFGGIYRRNHDC